MSDHAKIDDVFSIQETDDAMDASERNDIFPRSIDILTVPVTPSGPLNQTTNGASTLGQDGKNQPNNLHEDQSWGIPPQALENPHHQSDKEQTAQPQEQHQEDQRSRQAGLKLDLQLLHSQNPLKAPTNGFRATQDPNDDNVDSADTRDLRTILNEAASSGLLSQDQATNQNQSIERTVYFRLVSEKAKIESSNLQTPEYRQRNLALLHRIDAALSLLQEIISSGKTINEAQTETAQLDQQISERIHSQVSRQRSNAEQMQEPLDNQSRLNQNLPPLTLSIGEDVRLKLIRASILKDIEGFVSI